MKELTSSNFDMEVMTTDDSIVVVDFWAEWCGPCKALGPTLEQLAKELSGSNVKIMKVNVDEASDLAQKYGIRGIPTLLFFKKGQVAKTLVGNQTGDEIKKTVKSIG